MFSRRHWYVPAGQVAVPQASILQSEEVSTTSWVVSEVVSG